MCLVQSGMGRPETGFVGRITQLLGRIHYRRMETKADLEAVGQLRYKAYLKEGAINASAEESLIDRFDELGTFVNFGAFIDDKLAGAVRIHILDGLSQPSPALDAFPDVLLPLLQAGKRIIDPNRYVVDYEAARRYPGLAYVTIRLAFLAATHYDANLSTATVRAEHQAFYKR